jgi:hypothetical protein
LNPAVIVSTRTPRRWGEQPLRTILARMRHEHCGGRAAKAELLTGAEAAASGLVRRIVLRGG